MDLSDELAVLIVEHPDVGHRLVVGDDLATGLRHAVHADDHWFAPLREAEADGDAACRFGTVALVAAATAEDDDGDGHQYDDCQDTNDLAVETSQIE